MSRPFLRQERTSSPEDQRKSPYPEDQRSSPYPEDHRKSPYLEDRRCSPYPEDHRNNPYPEDQRNNPEDSSLEFQDLPPEVALRIFSYFTPTQLQSNIAPVCKTWWQNSKDPSLYKVLDVSDYYLNQDILKDLFNRYTMLEQLTLRRNSRHKVYAKDLLGGDLTNPTLKGLVLWNFVICKEVFQNFDDKFPALESIRFCMCEFTKDIQEIVESIASITRLKYLKFLTSPTLLGDFDDFCLSTISNKCTKLQSLHLRCTPHLTNAAVKELAVLRNETLHCLDLDGRGLTDRSLTALGSCSNLVELRLAHASDFTDRTLEALANLQLHTLELNVIYKDANLRVTSTGLVNFFSSRHRIILRNLALENFLGLDDSALKQVARKCKQLRKMTVSYNSKVTDAGIEFLFRSLPQLRNLFLQNCLKVTQQVISSAPKMIRVSCSKWSDRE